MITSLNNVAIRTVFPDSLIGASLSKNNAAELLSTIPGGLVFANALDDLPGTTAQSRSWRENPAKCAPTYLASHPNERRLAADIVAKVLLG